MLKIVVFDCGQGGESFADRLEELLSVAEIIRVIDSPFNDSDRTNSKRIRRFAEEVLEPYIGKVDLIILANHFLSITSLKYFEHKYPSQKFLGFKLKAPDSYIKRRVLVLTTKPLAKTFAYRSFIFRLKRKVKTIMLDAWPAKIDDDNLTITEVRTELENFILRQNFQPEEAVLACSQFSAIKPELRIALGHNIKIYDCYDEIIYRIYKILRIRGNSGRRNK